MIVSRKEKSLYGGFSGEVSKSAEGKNMRVIFYAKSWKFLKEILLQNIKKEADMPPHLLRFNTAVPPAAHL